MNFFKLLPGIVLVLISSGCATTSDRQQTQLEGAAIGCGIGAVIGNLIGQDREATAIGCAAMGMAGAAYGKHVADQKEQYATREEHFKAVIKSAKDVRADAEAYNQQISNQIASVRREIDQLKKSTTSAYSKNQKLTQQKQKAERILKEAEKKLVTIQQEIKKQKSFLASNRQGIDSSLIKASYREISQLETENRALQIALAELKSIDNRRAY